MVLLSSLHFSPYFITGHYVWRPRSSSSDIFRAWLLCQALLVLKWFLKCYYFPRPVGLGLSVGTESLISPKRSWEWSGDRSIGQNQMLTQHQRLSISNKGQILICRIHPPQQQPGSASDISQKSISVTSQGRQMLGCYKHHPEGSSSWTRSRRPLCITVNRGIRPFKFIHGEKRWQFRFKCPISLWMIPCKSCRSA